MADRNLRWTSETVSSPSLRSYLSPLPLIAVLRGIAPPEIPAIAGALTDHGFRILEVPLNSPDPFVSIKLLADAFGSRCLTGAGTVLKIADVARVAEAGGRLIVMPHADVAIIREAKRLGLLCAPGVATMTEAFAALDAGADGLKMFPAELLSPAVLKAWRAVLPKDVLVFAVGGIRPDNMAAYWDVGASGFGTGSNLYKPGAPAHEVRAVAAAYAAGFAALEAR
jgi:2-dehydro-3-deoxyphosphogalactonate aldolase